MSSLPDEFTHLWQRDFSSSDKIQWPHFRSKLAAALKQSGDITDEDDRHLKAIIDREGTGSISAGRFCKFLRGFGSLSSSLYTMRRVLAEKWFFAYTSAYDVARLLTNQSPGSFLVCFDCDNPSSFRLWFATAAAKVQSIRVKGIYGEGLRVPKDGKRFFKTLYDVLAHYRSSRCLSAPFTASLRRESWFYGTLSSQDAETYLRALLKVGTFMVRSWDDSYFLTYVAPDESIQDNELCIARHGVLHQERMVSVIVTITELIRSKHEMLRYPYDPEGIPKLRICPLDAIELATLAGPSDGAPEAHNRHSSGKSATTLPAGLFVIPRDYFAVHALRQWSVLCLADGLGHGARPREASQKATEGVVNYTRSQCASLHELVDVSHALLRGFMVGHTKIIEGKESLWDAATTTLLAGAVVELHEADRQGECRYAFVCTVLGHCVAFRWSPTSKTLVKITTRNEISKNDPGGRLGPYLSDGLPDLRNLRCFFELCCEDDVIVAMNDGVYDNLDPEFLGKNPSDFGCTEAAWDQVPPTVAALVKRAFLHKGLRQLLEQCVTPKQVVDAVIAYSLTTTHVTRRYAEENPKLRLPSDYKFYPGRMDHATCVAVLVGPNANP